MTAPIRSFATDISKVRALIPDIELLDNPNRPDDPAETLFTDDHLQSLLDLNYGDIRLAAADALGILASSELLILKVIKTEDFQTDGAKVAAQFMARAAALREQADTAGDSDVDGFQVVPFTFWPPHWEPKA